MMIDRLGQFIDHLEISVRSFENTIGASNGLIRKAITNKTDIQSKWISAIVDNYPQLNLDWLLTGKGEMIHTTTAVPVPAGRGIPLLPTAALCGFGTQAFDDLPVMGYYSVPEFRNADFLIGLIGDSMTPRFVPGDIVACRIVRERLFFQWNRIYAIYTGSQGAMVKRVKPSKHEGCILLISDNPNYEPFDIPLSDITALALVIGVIRVE